MNKAAARSALVLVLGMALLLSACSGSGSKASQGAEGTDTGAANTNAAQAAENGDAEPKAGDMSEKVAIQFIENGWINTPTTADDPWQKWINETYNVDFHLTAYPGKDLESKLVVQFSSNEPPDMIYVSDVTTMRKLYNQGVLLDDWTPYLDKVPTLAATFTDQTKAYASVQGKMIGLAAIPDPNVWTWKIRQDWLANLGLQTPATDQELLDVLRKFTKDDPDQNGKNDTWGITSAGSGANLGEISFLETMYGPSGFSIKDNKVDHSIVNGTHQKFLEFMRTVVEEKLIDPDWYTQGWEQRKPKLYDGRFGLVRYPGVLVNETEKGTGTTGKTVDWYDNIPTPKGSPEGGLLPPAGISNGLITVSAKAAKDPVKMERILHIIEASTYPNDGYWALRWGVGVNGQSVQDVEGGGKFVSLKGEAYRQDNLGAYDWGTWIGTRADGVLESMNETPGESDKRQMDMDGRAVKMPAYPNYEAVLNLDPQIRSDLDKMLNEFDAKFVLGEATDYDAFAKQWLAAGGQKLMDDATEQFKAVGMIK